MGRLDVPGRHRAQAVRTDHRLPGTQLGNDAAWSEAMNVAFDAERNWALPAGSAAIVPGASHFAALSIASPNWRNAYQVATIGDHTFYKVQNLKPRQS